ncbi:MAG: homoserine dehydrogenase [Eubacteriales bacterium]|nr:homoserine dehydrogenase [Eubacteriales bacterium]
MAKIAILGYGTVGGGVYDIFNNSSFLKKTGEEIEVAKILDIRDFPDHPQKELFTKDFNDIVNDAEISVVAETMGGLHPAYEFTKSLLEAGKSVTTSNKELVATYGPELLTLAAQKGVRYMFEASVGGGIPVIRPIASCLQANDIERIAGILNGTTNFILSEMIDKGSEFEDALADAQQRGYAERNPAADIEGHDACRKIAILSSMATGYFVDYSNIPTEGICNVSLNDVKYAEKLGSAIKLIGYSQQMPDGTLYACVAPMLVKKSIPLSGVCDVFNAVMVRGNYLGDAMFYGRGAGKEATASAVCADVIDIVKNGAAKCPILWETDKIKMMAPEEKEWSYFVRTSAGKEQINEMFGDVELIDDVVSGEVGFVTSLIKEKDFVQAVNKLGGTYIKVLEA